MDLAESILKELVSLQKKNEELVSIITRLEHESDVIIHQFENKIADLNKSLKKAQDSLQKTEKKYDNLVRESENEREKIVNDKISLEQSLNSKISELRAENQLINSQLIDKEGCYLELSQKKESAEEKYKKDLEKNRLQLAESEVLLEQERKTSARVVERVQDEYRSSLKEIQKDLRKKEDELRILATDLKTRIETHYSEKKEWKSQVDKAEEKINDLRVQVTNEINIRKSIENELNYNNSQILQKNQDLELQVSLLSEKMRGEQNRLSKIIEELELEKGEFEGSISTLNNDIDKLRSHYSELEDLYQSAIKINSDKDRLLKRIQEESSIKQNQLEAHVNSLLSVLSEKESAIKEKDEFIIQIQFEKDELKEKKAKEETVLSETISLLNNKISSIEFALQESREIFSKDKNILNEQVQDLISQNGEIVRQKNQREEEFREEISGIHQELIRKNEQFKEQMDSKSREISEKDRQITLISGNNEAIRSELERVRSRLLVLEKTIRADQEEPVHALYRQIQNLSSKLAAKESENSVLSSRIIRLDSENTRLSRLLADTGSYRDDKESTNSGSKKESKTRIVSPDISGLLPNLDDPMQAMEAALKIIRLGNQVVDTLIPLLYRGTLQRRAWVAVILYEINDPKAVKPLSDLLETHDGDLREIIWDIRLRFREWRRVHATSMTV